MTLIGGADGCPIGWIAVERDTRTDELQSRVVGRIGELFADGRELDVLAIDIPIGLTESGPRECDVLARSRIRPRGSSVFPAPIRSALAGETYEDAGRISRERQDRGISKQAFMIYPRIRAVDEALRADQRLRDRVYEVHPEVCFHAWNGGRPMLHAKNTFSGAHDRYKLVESVFGADAFARIRAQHRPSAVADDDILDAFAALWTAGRIVSGTAQSLPEIVPFDAAGLPMRMMY
jgi:predicted RNase H-like nuclease